MPQVPQQRGPPPAPRPVLQSRQFHVDIGLAEGGGALVADDTKGEFGEDRDQGRSPWPLCHFPIGRGCRSTEPVPENLGLD